MFLESKLPFLWLYKRSLNVEKQLNGGYYSLIKPRRRTAEYFAVKQLPQKREVASGSKNLRRKNGDSPAEATTKIETDSKCDAFKGEARYAFAKAFLRACKS